MATVYSILSAIKEALSDIEGIATCDIGISPDITDSDYPLIRIVPERGAHGSSAIGRILAEVWIYVGAPVVPAEGLDAVYSALDALETAVREKMEAGNGFIGEWIETVYDDQEVEGGYRLLASKYQCVA